MRFIQRLGIATAALCAFSVSAVYAQTVTGSVAGTVLDPSGAAVPNASITAVNVNTGVQNSVTSNALGVYSIRFLPIGLYRVEVVAPGFAKVTVPAFTLEIDQTAKVDAHVTVGADTSVNVSALAAPILDTTDGTIGLSLTADQIETIPLNGRNFSSVTLFQPGAVNTDPQGLTAATLSNEIPSTTVLSRLMGIGRRRITTRSMAWT